MVREMLQKYKKTDLFKGRVICSFTLFGTTYEGPEQSIPHLLHQDQNVDIVKYL